jgi:molybdate/tungstate transport system substrate-binding protein
MKVSKKTTRGLTTKVIVGVIIAVIVIAAIVALLLYHPSSTTTSTSSVSSSSGPIIVYVAGAYKAIFDYLAQQFEKQYGIPVKVVPGGSFGLAAEIAQGQQANVFVPVAYLQAVELEGNNNPGWAIAFISDQMAIVYTNYTTQSPYWNELYGNYTMAMKTNETQYWYNFFYLLTTKFSLGISNPSSDPEGLYAMLILKMAGYLYANHSFDYFIKLAEPNIKSAPTTADYVPALEAGELDFVFSYKSYAISQHFEYLTLPSWLSFGYYPNETNWYSFFFYKINVSGQTIRIYGNPVYLYITIPKNTPNFNESLMFLEFVINHVNGLAQFGVTPITHPVLFYENESDVPSQILNLLNQGVLQYGGTFPSL